MQIVEVDTIGRQLASLGEEGVGINCRTAGRWCRAASREMLDHAFHVPVDPSRIERPARERSRVPQNRCLAERVGGKAPTITRVSAATMSNSAPPPRRVFGLLCGICYWAMLGKDDPAA
jgi:hypothetical protein